jgi:hypothetical protein
MEQVAERRRERRLSYHWPVWFAEDFDEVLTQGQMTDVSSGGAAFVCHNDGNSFYPGQQITTRFSVPRFHGKGAFAMASFTRKGKICRVDDFNPHQRKIAIQFTEALSFKPGEQAESEIEEKQKLQAVTI